MSGSIPVRFDSRIKMPKVATTGKCFIPPVPTRSLSRLRIASTPTSKDCCRLFGDSTESFPRRIVRITTATTLTNKNITTCVKILLKGFVFAGPLRAEDFQILVDRRHDHLLKFEYRLADPVIQFFDNERDVLGVSGRRVSGGFGRLRPMSSLLSVRLQKIQ